MKHLYFKSAFAVLKPWSGNTKGPISGEVIMLPQENATDDTPYIIKQAAIIVASFVYQASTRAGMLPRKPLKKGIFVFDGL